jgi:hypothetical protein
MYDREHTLALIEEARSLTAALKIETRQIGIVIDRAFDSDGEDVTARNGETVAVSPRKSKWWFWR